MFAKSFLYIHNKLILITTLVIHWFYFYSFGTFDILNTKWTFTPVFKILDATMEGV